jgi:hypothetical protein
MRVSDGNRIYDHAFWIGEKVYPKCKKKLLGIAYIVIGQLSHD